MAGRRDPRRAQQRRRAERRGRLAEAVAALWLRLKGYQILEKRYKTPLGEVDLIARRGEVIAFVEVKARADLRAGLEAVTPHQRRRSTRAVLAYLMHRPEAADYALRFDILVVRPLLPPRHMPDAWRGEGEGLP